MSLKRFILRRIASGKIKLTPEVLRGLRKLPDGRPNSVKPTSKTPAGKTPAPSSNDAAIMAGFDWRVARPISTRESPTQPLWSAGCSPNEEAFQALPSCRGVWFQLPSPTTCRCFVERQNNSRAAACHHQGNKKPCRQREGLRQGLEWHRSRFTGPEEAASTGRPPPCLERALSSAGAPAR